MRTEVRVRKRLIAIAKEDFNFLIIRDGQESALRSGASFCGAGVPLFFLGVTPDFALPLL